MIMCYSSLAILSPGYESQHDVQLGLHTISGVASI